MEIASHILNWWQSKPEQSTWELVKFFTGNEIKLPKKLAKLILREILAGVRHSSVLEVFFVRIKMRFKESFFFCSYFV